MTYLINTSNLHNYFAILHHHLHCIAPEPINRIQPVLSVNQHNIRLLVHLNTPDPCLSVQCIGGVQGSGCDGFVRVHSVVNTGIVHHHLHGEAESVGAEIGPQGHDGAFLAHELDWRDGEFLDVLGGGQEDGGDLLVCHDFDCFLVGLG